jgi:all-trans-retinol 13,14-reductase
MTLTNADRARLTAPSSVDVAIIGSGPGGLVAAAALAQKGLRVAVFEAHYTAGGCATQFSRGPKKERYFFDIGLHYIGDCEKNGAIPRMMRDLGTDPIDYLPMDQDGFDTFVFPDFEFRVPANVELYRERLLSMFPHEKRGIDTYVKYLRAVMKAGEKIDANGGRMSLRVAASIGLDLMALAKIQTATIGEVLDSCVRDPKLKAVLLGQNGDYGLPPSKASALLHLGLAGHYFRGAYYPRGGGQIISDKIVERIEALGGAVHLRRPVSKIVVENGRAVGVELEGKAGNAAEIVRANTVISNADLILTMDKLLGREHLTTEWQARLPKFEMAAALFMTFLGVKGKLSDRGMRPANYWQFDSYDMEGFYGDLSRTGEVNAHGCYITSASMKDPETPHHAPEGISTVEIMTVVPGENRRWNVADDAASAWEYKDNAAYREQKLKIEDDLVARYKKLFPTTDDEIVFRESATPVSHYRYTKAHGGTGYGLAATPAQFMKGRPGYRGPVEGLYLAGASTRAGHGIVGAMMSGENSAKRILADLGRL